MDLTISDHTGEKKTLSLRDMGDGRYLGTLIPASSEQYRGPLSREILEELPFPVTIMDLDMQMLYGNPPARKELKFLGKKGKKNKERKELLDSCITTGEPHEGIIRSDESGESYELISIPIQSSGRTTQVLEIWRDVTPDMKRLKESSETKAVGSELLETSNAIIVGLDPEGYIKLFNQGAQRILDYDKEDVLDTSWFDYLLEDKADKGVLQVFQWNIGSGFRTQYENRVRSGSGKILTVSWENTVIFDEDGDVSMILMVGQDITQTKKLEQSLRDHGRQLSRALNEISIYNDLMLHDMKNINAAIMGYLQLITLEGIDPDKRKVYAEKALMELRKGSDITNDVRIMARAQSEVAQKPVPIAETLENVSSRVREIPGLDTLELSYEKSELSVLADDLIDEALLQLLKQISEGAAGKVNVEISVKRDPSLEKMILDPVHMRIMEDVGFISEEEVDTLFSREPIPGEVSNRLGFYLVKKIIDRYGGHLWVEKGEGSGTTTHMVLSESI